MAPNEISLNPGAYTALGLEPYDQEAPGTPRVLSLLSLALERSIWKNEKCQRKNDPVTVFHGTEAPSLSVFHYMERIFKYSNCSPSCFVMAYIYIERFLLGTGSCLTSLNVHRLLISSVMIAAKFNDDKLVARLLFIISSFFPLCFLICYITVQSWMVCQSP